ncbi:hypothetical protein AB0E85_25630 [Streptomyces sp. NPDC029044]|uniref:hypothetical protein n=1 Tax=Streptomyces sp. NPDC029044 TaxID=3157198 RepID=UPI0033DD64D6
MSITQQHLLDAYRARSLGEPLPPAPGTHDGRAVREGRSRPARSGLRDVLGRWRRRPT